MKKLSMNRGKIECQYTITCGKCDANSKIVDSIPSEIVIRKWKNQGWLHTVTDGWVCPKHKNEKNDNDKL